MAIDLREALAHHRRGDLDRASLLYEEALEDEPARADVLHLLGLVALQRGEPDRAVELIGRAIERRPDVADYHSAMAEAHWVLGQFDRAVASGREALRLDPGNPEILCNLGSSLVGMGEVDGAIGLFRAAIRHRPEFPQAYNNLGHALQLRGDSASAIEHFRASARLDPTSAEVHANLGKILLDRGEPEEALEHCREAIRLRKRYAEALINLGNVLQVLGRLEEAEASLREAIRVRPNSSAALASLAGVLEQLGHAEKSLETLREALRIDPGHAGALARLATRLRARLPEGEQAAVERLLAGDDLTTDRRLPLLYGLAHVLDDRGDFDRSAGLTLEANALQREENGRRGLGYDPRGHSRFVDQLIRSFTPDFFERVRGWGLPTARPVFVVGMPRSGTSLVEQILATHPEVHGAGELRLAGKAFGALLGPSGGTGSLRECLDRLDRPALEQLGRGYLDGLEALDGSAARVVDKMPENTLHLGLIAALFPGATLIHCRRDPRDVALSCWMTHFGQLRWSCDPGHIAARIAESDRVMDHWRRVLPVPVFEIRYEELVDDPEGQSRELVERCGLGWDPRCLKFHETRRAVQTASVMQVRRPIYRGSVGRWRNYERSLAPLFEALGSAGVAD